MHPANKDAHVPEKGKCVSTSISFAPAVLEWLKRESSCRGVPVSHIVEDAVRVCMVTPSSDPVPDMACLAEPAEDADTEGW